MMSYAYFGTKFLKPRPSVPRAGSQQSCPPCSPANLASGTYATVLLREGLRIPTQVTPAHGTCAVSPKGRAPFQELVTLGFEFHC